MSEGDHLHLTVSPCMEVETKGKQKANIEVIQMKAILQYKVMLTCWVA